MVKTTKFPDLNQSAVSGRIISISSELHRAAPSSTKFANVNEVASLGAPKDVNESKDLSAHGLYGRSKLANIAFTRMLVDKVIHPNKYKVIVMATHPGAVHTAQQDQFKEAYGEVIGTALKYATIPFMKTPDQGSASTVWAAVDPSVEAEKEKWQGAYVTNPGEKSDPSSQALDDEIAENLWKLSKQLIEEQVGKDGLADWDMTTTAKAPMA
ncbi:hypothetical protein ONZ45_g3470 [Pleurotus djamor]|nr:hypothetical protein ONZ45_g3470 [Pleurotus djamor]